MSDEQSVSNEPLYNIGVVSRITGISMATLRAWERRYDFPDSHRTAGGHRLYSEQDIMRLRWVKRRVDEGLQTAQSIQALRHHESTGQPVLLDQLLQPAPAFPEIVQEKREEVIGFQEAMQVRLMTALLRRDIQQADGVLSEALALSTADEITLRIIGPVLTRVGDLWEEGKISVANEHLATNYLRQRLLMWMVGGPPPRDHPPIVLACAPDEWHEGSLLILGALLRRRRWPIAYLGQSVPLADLASFVKDINPSLVVLVAMTENSASYLVDWPTAMPEIARAGRPVLGYGGRVFVESPEWRLRVPGIFLGSTFEEGILTIEKLLQGSNRLDIRER